MHSLYTNTNIMRQIFCTLLAIVALATAYTTTTTGPVMGRRGALKTTAAGFFPALILPTHARAISPFFDDYVNEGRNYEVVDGQQATGGRLDLNSAYVTDYKQLRGLYPSIAGKVGYLQTSI